MKRRSFMGLLAAVPLLGTTKPTKKPRLKRKAPSPTINEILGEPGNRLEIIRLMHGQSPGPNLLGKQTWGNWI